MRQFHGQSDMSRTMWRRTRTGSPKAKQRAVRLGLSAFLVLVPFAAHSAAVGRLLKRMEYGRPVLSWSNRLGEAYVVQTTSNLAAPVWQRRATLTTEAVDLSWGDDTLPGQEMFYRVALATNATVFQTLQQALHRGCTDQGIVGASVCCRRSPT